MTPQDRGQEPADVFSIQARRCKRCGGLLTSAQAIRDGYGPVCKAKMRQEEREREINANQYSLFEGEGAGLGGED